jgi:hypothetical protein
LPTVGSRHDTRSVWFPQGPRKITLGGAKRNSAGYSYGTAPIDLAKAGRTASSLMRIAKGASLPFSFLFFFFLFFAFVHDGF